MIGRTLPVRGRTAQRDPDTLRRKESKVLGELGLEGSDFWTYIVLVGITLPILLALGLPGYGLNLHSGIYYGGTTVLVLVALVSYLSVLIRRASPVGPASDRATTGALLESLKQWLLKRGLLFLLLETPIIAVIGGLFLQLAPYSLAIVLVLLSFALLPIWISYRRQVSDDPDEPVFHLHKYAMYSVLPMSMFTVARIPSNPLFGMIYWHPWYDFGAALTGLPKDQYTSLLVGSILYSIQGYSLAMGYYVLFRRHTLINAILYLDVFISSIYSYVFPAYSRVGLATSVLWQAVVWWGHLWMALTAWYVPRFCGHTWPKLPNRARTASILAIGLIVLMPYGYVLWRATYWQFPYQKTIDTATFDRSDLMVLEDEPTMIITRDDTQYEYHLRFGPRSYSNYYRAIRVLDAGPVQVTGRLTYLDQPIAWCSTYIGRLDTANQIKRPLDFPSALERTEYSSIPVRCIGPSGRAAEMEQGTPLVLTWTARVNLIGDREQVEREFEGEHRVRLRVGVPTAVSGPVGPASAVLHAR
jgi:hypothetical protein